MIKRLIPFIVICAIWAVGPLAVSNCSSTDGGGGGGGGQPALTSDDFPGVTPCSDRDTLPDDADFLKIIDDVLLAFNLLIPFVDNSSIPAVCGEEGEWDPNDFPCPIFFGTEIFSPTFQECMDDAAAISSAGLGNMSICRTGFTFPDMGAERGFPKADTYRGDICIESGGMSYLVRIRVMMSGPDADKKYTDAGLADEADLELFSDGGTALLTREDIKDEITASPESVTFTLRSGGGATTHLTIKLEIICVRKLTDDCATYFAC